MMQLTFQAALDPFHAMFRFLRLRNIYQNLGRVSVDHAKIIDFYILFPFRIVDIRLRPEHRKLKQIASKYAHTKPYGQTPNDRLLFERMRPMQEAALETLASYGNISASKLRQSWVVFEPIEIAAELSARIEELNIQEFELIDFARLLAVEYPTMGANGLKHRTELMEHRYDVV